MPGFERQYNRQVLVVLMFQDDDLNHKVEVNYGPLQEATIIAEAFRPWGFEVHQYHIPFHHTNASVQSFLWELTNSTIQNDLFVVYYVGHASHIAYPNSNNSVIRQQEFNLTASFNGTYAVLDWQAIHATLERAPCDVLVFLNCCRGALSWSFSGCGQHMRPGKTMTTIAATGSHELAHMSRDYSFGSLLVYVLARERWGGCTSSTVLLERLIDAANKFRPLVRSVDNAGVPYGPYWAMRPLMDPLSVSLGRNVFIRDRSRWILPIFWPHLPSIRP
ncbi:uncharacterized protein PG998_000200 [Apiospora kogelbergensis]|uniref:uncharacterized protein n=1 Tax=Apiospora kogelbergensis TaxID=1337665 RepID=UPI00312F1A69